MEPWPQSPAMVAAARTGPVAPSAVRALASAAPHLGRRRAVTAGSLWGCRGDSDARVTRIPADAPRRAALSVADVARRTPYCGLGRNSRDAGPGLGRLCEERREGAGRWPAAAGPSQPVMLPRPEPRRWLPRSLALLCRCHGPGRRHGSRPVLCVELGCCLPRAAAFQRCPQMASDMRAVRVPRLRDVQ